MDNVLGGELIDIGELGLAGRASAERATRGQNFGTYLLFILFLSGIYVAIVLEEWELVARCGDAYREYQRRVQRFLLRPVLQTTRRQQ